MWRVEAEARGPEWVQAGQLMVRPDGQTYGPNYPGKGGGGGGGASALLLAPSGRVLRPC